VEELQVRRGGVAPNICFGMGNLGLRPLLIGGAGADFEDYRAWLQRHGVDTSGVRISELKHTARFVCTTDRDHAQIATFYSGAMSEARTIELAPLLERFGGADLVVISANDPEAMLRHTEECRSRGYPFMADPSQHRALVDGATYLLSNEYEAALTEQKTGWSADEILERVGTRVTTLGPKGARIEAKGSDPITVPVARELRKADPTGVGDAFRAGFLAGLAWDLDHELCAQVGSMLATYVIETVGTQEYELGRGGFLERFESAYGAGPTSRIEPHLRCLRP
jgi:adenosine kinase